MEGWTRRLQIKNPTSWWYGMGNDKRIGCTQAKRHAIEATIKERMV
jgi:hypothetical protein